MSDKYLDKELYSKLLNIANRRIRDPKLRQEYINSMYMDLGGKVKEDEKVESTVEVDSDTDCQLENLFAQSSETEEVEKEKVEIGDLMESDDKNFRFMVKVGNETVYFGKVDDIIIWEITGSINRIKTRYIKSLGDANDPFKSNFWVKHVLWSNSEENIEEQFEIARDQAEMILM